MNGQDIFMKYTRHDQHRSHLNKLHHLKTSKVQVGAFVHDMISRRYCEIAVKIVTFRDQAQFDIILQLNEFNVKHIGSFYVSESIYNSRFPIS